MVAGGGGRGRGGGINLQDSGIRVGGNALSEIA